MSREQLELYESITNGPRAKVSANLVGTGGALGGPFGPMIHSPSMGGPLQALGAAIRFESTLEPLLRESITLLVAKDEQSSYEWRAHERLAREAGVSDDDIEALRRGEVPESHDPQRDQALHFARAVLTDNLDDSAYSQFQNHLEDALMVEIVILVGYYRALALLLRVFTIN